MKVIKFCKMMTDRDHKIFHYGNTGATVECFEHINILSRKELYDFYGYDEKGEWKNRFFKFNHDDKALKRYNEICSVELLKRVRPGDFVLTFFGISMIETINKLPPDVTLVEPGIGYDTAFAPYRVYESHSVMAYNQGKIVSQHPDMTHTVIPNYFNPDEFEESVGPGEYWVILGRVILDKGGDLAYRCAKTREEAIVFAGQGELEEIGVPADDPLVKFERYVNIDARKKLLKGARGLIIMSRYVEPFGGVAVEALISGVPVIAANRGAFPEFIINGFNGYLVHTTSQIMDAMNNIARLDRRAIRVNALSRFSMESVAKRYESYFDTIDYYRMFGNNTYRSRLFSEFSPDTVKTYCYDYVIIQKETFHIDKNNGGSFLIISPSMPTLGDQVACKEDKMGIPERNLPLICLDYFKMDVTADVPGVPDPLDAFLRLSYDKIRAIGRVDYIGIYCKNLIVAVPNLVPKAAKIFGPNNIYYTGNPAELNGVGGYMTESVDKDYKLFKKVTRLP